MAVDERLLQDLPEWYRTEKETQKTLQRLDDLKAIRFYLEHSDPYIRRLAIIRASQLKNREAYTLLSEVSEDAFETQENRETAARLMVELNDELGLGFFLHTTLAFQTSEGDAAGGMELKVLDHLPDIHFQFSNSLIASQLILDQTLQRSHMEDAKDLFSFSLKAWCTRYAKSAFQDLGRGVIKLLKGLCTLLRGLPKVLLSCVRKGWQRLCEIRAARKEAKVCLQAQAQASASGSETASDYALASAPACTAQKPDIPAPSIKPVQAIPQRAPAAPRAYRIRRSKTGIPLRLKIRDACRTFFRMAFWPLRVIFRFKYVILCTLVVMYAGLSFTTPGKAFLFRINPRFYQANVEFQESVADLALSAFHGTLFMEAAPTDQPVPLAAEIKQPEAKRFVVTAAKGLYLRLVPAPDGERLLLMYKGTSVVYQSERSDGKGATWYQVLLQDGTVGWANAQYLKEAPHE